MSVEMGTPEIWVLRVCRRVDTRRYRYAAPPELEEAWVAGSVYRYGTPNGVWREDGVRVFSPVGTVYR